MYFFGFGVMGNLNSGVPYPWASQLEPIKISGYLLTVIFALLSHFVLFRKFYYKKPRWHLFIGILVLLVLYIATRYTVQELIFPATLGVRNYYPGFSFRFYAIDNIYFGGIIIFIGFVLFLFDEMFRNRQRQAVLEKENRKAELNFLQAQMNPHFLFNSLNNIYSLAYEQHPNTADAVMKLGDIMRYVTEQRGNTVSLEKELEYTRNLLEMEQLRHDYPLQARISVTAPAAACRVPSLLLIPLIENAIKYGDLTESLSIVAATENKELKINISNKISATKRKEGTGLGLKNLRRRLELTYEKGQFAFESFHKDENYIVQITLPQL